MFTASFMNRPIRVFAAVILCAFASGLHAAESQVQLASVQAKAGQGDPQAQTELAVKYENAEGLPKDFQEAARLYCLAAKQGYAEAQYRLGWMYANGRGRARDDGTAAALLRMAAERGHESAAKLLPFLRAQPQAQLPSCLLPDPPAPEPVQAAQQEDSVAARAPKEIVQLVRRLAPQYDVDWKLAVAVIAFESGFNATAVSPKNAQGLMQLIPATAARFGVKKVRNPVENIKGGLAYLRWLLAFFKGDVALVVAAYNAGEGAVEKYRGVPPYAETLEYVRNITGVYKKSNHPYESLVTAPSPIMARMDRLRR